MKLIKVSPNFQITIPKAHHRLCRNGWFSMTVEDRIIMLRPVEISEAKTEEEFLKLFLK
jgi:hypothetical protein